VTGSLVRYTEHCNHFGWLVGKVVER